MFSRHAAGQPSGTFQINILMRINEIYNDGDLETIDLSDDEQCGSIEGYVVDTDAVQIDNWVSKQRLPPKVADFIRKHHGRVAFLNNLYVQEECRNRKIGAQLVYDFFDAATLSGAEAAYLIADTEEQNPFDLIKWYKDFGFKQLTGGANPLMMLRF